MLDQSQCLCVLSVGRRSTGSLLSVSDDDGDDEDDDDVSRSSS